MTAPRTGRPARGRRAGILAKLALSLFSLALFYAVVEGGARLVWRADNHGGPAA